MGYSYAAKAGLVLEALDKLMGMPTSNGLPNGGFYEFGREQKDGAIVGTVWKPAGGNMVTKAGGFRISPQGVIERFPGIPKALKQKAQTLGQAMFAAKYEKNSFASLKVMLEQAMEMKAPKGELWVLTEAVAQAYQLEAHVMFLGLPENEPEAIKSWLEGLAN